MEEKENLKDANIIRETGEDGKEILRLDIVEEFKKIQDGIEDVKFYMTNCDDEDEYNRLEEEENFLLAKREDLLIQNDKWAKQASVMEQLTVEAITSDGTNYYVNQIGATYEDVINDSEVQSNKELMNKLQIFKEKCYVVTDFTNICLCGEYKDGKFICESIYGEQEIINRNARIASINFKTGNIKNYHDSINPDMVIDEYYEDPSIIDKNLTVEQTQEQNERKEQLIDDVQSKMEKKTELETQLSQLESEKAQTKEGATKDE